MASRQSTASIHHLHPVDDICPTCEQPIPHDRAEEVARRLGEQREEQAAELTAKLEGGFELKLAELAEQARLQTEQQVDAARIRATAAADRAAQERVDTATARELAAKDALAAKTAEADAASSVAATTQAELTEQLSQVRSEAAENIARAKEEAAAAAAASTAEELREAQEGKTAAEEALATKTAEAEASAAAALRSQSEHTEQLAQTKRDAEDQILQVRSEAASNVIKAREEATAAATAAANLQVEAANTGRAEAEAVAASLQARLATKEQEAEAAIATAVAEATSEAQARVNDAEALKIAAEEAAATATAEAESIKAAQETKLGDALKEQREALEADKASAISSERSAAFEEKQKLSERLDSLQRALDKKTAEELGEGAEIDLFEALKTAFEDDRIVRTPKGQQGADIIHTVIHNGLQCGTIIYDSKNHGAWRNEFIAKLRSDQMAAGAEHAVLTALKFPQGARQLHLQDGVLVANPARVIAIVEMMRRHMVQAHTLRMSAQQRAEKTAALYDFITSDQCAGMFERLEGHAQTLLDIQVAERAAHERVWKQQGIAIRSSQKVQAELRTKIDLIIGTGSALESQG